MLRRTCLVFLLPLACASPPPATPPPAIDVARADAGAVPDPSKLASPHVTAAFLEAGPGAWQDAIRFQGSPAELAKPCYARALDADPDLAGIVWLDLVVGPARTAATVRSASVPTELAQCIADAMAPIRLPDGWSFAPPVVLYVSLSGS